MTAPDRSSSDTNCPIQSGCSILLSAERRLQQSDYSAVRRVRCEFQQESGVLHLRGAVRSHYLKQVAQELVIDVDGVRLVSNQINVARTAPLQATRDPDCPQDVDPSSGT